MTAVSSLPERRLENARRRLSELVVSQAEASAVRVGFGWEPSPDAPDTFDELRAEFSSSAETGRPLRVATVNVEPSIFTGPEVNFAMRFWHAVTHIESGQAFGFDGEMTGRLTNAVRVRPVVGPDFQVRSASQ